MKFIKQLFFGLLAFFAIAAISPEIVMAQGDPYDVLLEETNGIIELDFPVAGTVGQYRFQEAYFNDYTSYPTAYIPDSVAVGQEIWDSKGDRFVIVVVNQLYPAMDIEVDPLHNNGVPPNPGTSLLFDPTDNLWLALQTTNLPEKLKIAVFNHNMEIIDRMVAEAGAPQILTQNEDIVTLSNNGGSVSVRDGDYDALNEIQNLIATKDGVTVTVEIDKDGTNAVFNIEDADADPTNELQDLSVSQSGSDITISITNGQATTFSINDPDADPTNELQDISGSFDGSTLTVTLSDGNTATIDLSSLQGTDDQNISAAFNPTTNVVTLTMENGNTQNLDLSALADQQLTSTKAGNVYTLTLEGGGTVAIDVADPDADPLNEIQNLDNTKAGNLVTVTLDKGGASTVINVDDADADPTNELQDVTGSFDGDTLTVTLSDGNTAKIDLSALQGSDDQNITATLNTTTDVVTLTMEDGNTQTIDLSDYKDQQLTSSKTGSVYTLTLEDGGVVTLDVNDADADPTNELQDVSGSFDGTNLTVTLSDGNTATIDLSSLQGTDNQNITATLNTTTDVVTLVMEDGNTQTIDLSDYKDQQLSSSKTGSVYTLTLEDGGVVTVDVNDADADPTNELQDVSGSFDGTTLTVTLSDGNTATIDLSSLQGTDDQNITATLNTTTDVVTLVMEDGNTQTIDLSDYKDQQLTSSKTGSVYTLTLEGGGVVTVDVNDADADPTNELQDVSGSFDGTNLTVTLSDGNTATIDLSSLQGTDDQNITATLNTTTDVVTLAMEDGNTQTIDLSDYKDQQLTSSKTGSVYTLTLEDGGVVTVDVNDADADPTNELQDVSGSFDGTNLAVTLSDGNTATIDLSALQGTDDQNITATLNTTTDVVTLVMEDGNTQTIDFSDYKDQQLTSSKTGSVYTLTLEDGGVVTVDVNDADADPTNELQDVFGSFDGTNLLISLTDGNSATIDLSSLVGSDDQQISLVGNTLSLEDGGSVDLSSLSIVAKDTTIQYFNGNTGYISVTVNGVDFSGITFSWTNNVAKVTCPAGINKVHHATMKATAADLGGNIHGKLQIEVANNENQGYDGTMMPGTTTLFKKAVVQGSETWINTADTPPSAQVHFRVVSPGLSEYTFNNVDSYGTGWLGIVSK